MRAIRHNPVIQVLFEEAELRAERMIAWFRVGMSVLLMAVFITVLTIEPVPLSDVVRTQLIYAAATMASYFVWGVWPLLVLRAGKFQRWMVWLSALGDCAFILIGVWLGLRNSGVSGGFLSIMPTLWLVPIVLACGALRFNPMLQTVMGIALFGGLAGILGGVTRVADTVQFSELRFFFGFPPNVMRLVMVGIAATVLVVATVQIRRLFLSALQASEARKNLTRYLPEQMADDLADGDLEALRKGQRMKAAILFCDMRGFTTLSETLAPEDLSAFASEFRRKVSVAARANDGMIDKFMGDAVLMVFPGNAIGALNCARAILRGAEAWRDPNGDPVRLGIGLHYGQVFAGVVGDDMRLEYSVFGDAVNTAARLEALTKEKDAPLLVSDAFASECEGVDWTEVGQVTLRGKQASTALMTPSPPT